MIFTQIEVKSLMLRDNKVLKNESIMSLATMLLEVH